MAFTNSNMCVVAYANGFTLWHYTGQEMLAEITAPGYFDTVKTLMNTGDIVIINASDVTVMRIITQTTPSVKLATLA